LLLLLLFGADVMKLYLSFLSNFLILSLIISCSVSYENEVEKDYRIFVDTKDEVLLESIKILADRFNRDLGVDALQIVGSNKEANSKISFTQGLRADKQKLGLGQWILTTVSEGRELFPSDKPLKKTLIYSMQLDFDFDNFKVKSSDVIGGNVNSDNYQHLYHLFCHEVGHGLQMDHDDEQQSIMYKSIPDSYAFQPEYDYFFDEARLFFED
jgi:hypothetical protein